MTQEIVFMEVDHQRWVDMERLFEGRGGPKNCWCMVWRGAHGMVFDCPACDLSSPEWQG